jgi:putative sugar O-methyltransferase
MVELATRELTSSELSAITRVKNWVDEAIHTRDRLAASSQTMKPSLYWEFFSHAFEYVRSLPPEQFKSLRLHTYHLDGDTYQNIFFSKPEYFKERYKRLCHGLPTRYSLSAPLVGGEYGHVIEGKLINRNVIRWQELVRALWNVGVFTRIEQLDRPTFLEIGGGYGSLAHCFHRIFPDATYIIVDIPETLLFSAAYLTLIYGENRVMLFKDEGTPLEALKGVSFVMVPNYLVHSLSNSHFDLAINVQSFQEMTAKQVKEYLAFLIRRTDLFLSWNHDKNEFNTEEVSVTNLLLQFFNIRELRETPSYVFYPLPTAFSRFLKSALNLLLRSALRKYFPGIINESTNNTLKFFIGVPKRSSS